VHLRRLIEQFTINFTWLQKVTNLKTELYSSKLSLNKKARKSRMINLKLNNRQEDKKINKEEKREHKNNKSSDCLKYLNRNILYIY
jgi:hypothetical protein